MLSPLLPTGARWSKFASAPVVKELLLDVELVDELSGEFSFIKKNLPNYVSK
jgi:hypothetical protein|tara:strand:- start:1463 stop:1618 length:156 start_codon:yes stop_codon:yes gene_type:complete